MSEEKVIPEVLEPLTPTEAALVGTVSKWREEKRTQLEQAWQNILADSQNQIASVLLAHGLTAGDTWEIRDDENSRTGVSIAVRRGALLAKGEPPKDVVSLNRTQRRQLQRDIGKKARRSGGR